MNSGRTISLAAGPGVVAVEGSHGTVGTGGVVCVCMIYLASAYGTATTTATEMEIAMAMAMAMAMRMVMGIVIKRTRRPHTCDK